MIRRLTTLVAMTSLVILAGCWFKKDDAQTAQAAPLKVVNVLDASLFGDSHIKGSTNINFFELADKVSDWSKDAPIVVYCSNYACTASGDAVRQLNALGFTHVFAYEGGMAEWYQLSKQDATFAVEGPSEQGYLTVEMQKPEREEVADIKVVTAPELKQMMLDAQLL